MSAKLATLTSAWHPESGAGADAYGGQSRYLCDRARCGVGVGCGCGADAALDCAGGGGGWRGGHAIVDLGGGAGGGGADDGGGGGGEGLDGAQLGGAGRCARVVGTVVSRGG